jgi:LexA-binding, inner membrane-associated putative hydrolase
MMWFNHMPGGMAAWVAVSGALHLPPEAAILGAAPAALGSVVPDLDNPPAWLTRKVAWVIGSKPTARMCRRLGPHREGPAHSWPVGAPLAAALVGGLALLLTAVFGGVQWPIVLVSAAGGAVGQVSHGLLDGMTCNCWWCDPRASRTPDPGRRHISKVDGRWLPGCAMLWPFSRRRWGLPVWTVDSPQERGSVPVLLMILFGAAVGYAMTDW